MAFEIRNIFFVIVVLAFAILAKAETSSRTRRNAGQCGVSKVSTGLIFRGRDTRRGEFPWIVALMYTGYQPPQFFCSGVLISSTFVISVANCFHEKHSPELLLPINVLALFGVYRLDDPYEVERVGLKPEKIFIHETWNPRVTSYDADISLLKFVEGKLNILHSYISPICIWDSVDDPLANEGFVLGWGQSEDSSKTHETVPKLTTVAIHYNDDCLIETPQLLDIASERTFCAGNRNGSGVCLGDSGGGLYIKIDEVYYLKGLISSSLVTEDGCDTSNYAVYTNIHKFGGWIKQKTQGAFATSAKALINVFCHFRPAHSYHHGQRISTCSIRSPIDSDFFVIASAPSSLILGFAIHNQQNARFLPRHAGIKFPNLEELTASKCSLSIIRKFYFDRMRRVQFIDLSFNEITVVEKGSFKDLFSVKYLFLGNNQIDTLDSELFQVTVNLKTLDLAHNRISSLDSATFTIPGGKLLEANLLSNACINGTYEANEFVRLEADVRSKCPL